MTFLTPKQFIYGWKDVRESPTPFIFDEERFGFDFSTFQDPIDYCSYFIDDNILVGESNKHGKRKTNWQDFDAKSFKLFLASNGNRQITEDS